MLSRYRGERYRAAANPDLVAIVESDDLHAMDYEDALAFYRTIHAAGSGDDMAYLGCVDRYFLFTQILGRHDGYHPWLYDRCREVELEPDGFLDLWARFHFKSSLITFAGSIQEIINDPEITIGVLSHTKDISTKFVAQVKREFESNNSMRNLYPDVCWIKPSSEASVWSSREFTVRRRGNPKEATMEAHGLVDGQPTSRHFGLLIYDDIVTRESVNTPEQVKKTTEAWELSDSLKSGSGPTRKWMPGTRYSFMDTYADLIDRGAVKVRKYAATDNGRPDGKPVLMTQELWDETKIAQRSTLAAQFLQNPLSGKDRVFEPEWFKRWEVRPGTLNVYIMADPSRGRTSTSDRTAIAVIGIDTRGNKFFLDGMCHRMKLSERWANLKMLHKKWSKMPGVGFLKVGYERFGQQSDDEYFTERMREENYHFAITELAWPREGSASKQHRVERLQPDVQVGTFYFPAVVHQAGKGDCVWEVDMEEKMMRYRPLKGDPDLIRRAKERGQEYLAAGSIKRKNENGEVYDVTVELMEEMIHFPFGAHDDFVDATSRIYDMEPIAAMIDDEDWVNEKVPEDA